MCGRCRLGNGFRVTAGAGRTGRVTSANGIPICEVPTIPVSCVADCHFCHGVKRHGVITANRFACGSTVITKYFRGSACGGCPGVVVDRETFICNTHRVTGSLVVNYLDARRLGAVRNVSLDGRSVVSVARVRWRGQAERVVVGRGDHVASVVRFWVAGVVGSFGGNLDFNVNVIGTNRETIDRRPRLMIISAPNDFHVATRISGTLNVTRNRCMVFVGGYTGVSGTVVGGMPRIITFYRRRNLSVRSPRTTVTIRTRFSV